jgi:integrase
MRQTLYQSLRAERRLGTGFEQTEGKLLTVQEGVAYDNSRTRTEPKWRNWQTRQVQDLVPVKGVEVRVLSSAVLVTKGLTANNAVGPFCFPQAVGENLGKRLGSHAVDIALCQEATVASLERRNKTYRVVFMYRGRKHGYSLDTGDREMAEALRGGVEKTLMLIEQNLLQVPEGADIVQFVKNGGKVEEEKPTPPSARLTFSGLRDAYLAAHSSGAMEENSLETVKMPLRHLAETLGERFHVQELTLDDLQRHINRRAQKQYRGKPLSPTTLKKEVASFRAVWNWGVQSGRLKGTFLNRGLKFPKADEKPPFMTWAEIERKLPGLDERERQELWDCLFLQQPEVAELLVFVQGAGTLPWVYPVVCFAAHTGARRSEIIRVRLQDLDLEAGHVLIREKKRARGTRTHRRVPLSPFLVGVLRDWLKDHPGGSFLFCQAGEVARSKKRSRPTGHKGEKSRKSSLKGRMATVRKRETAASSPLTKDEAHDHFQRTMAGSKWSVLRGWHVLRHSFISNCAAQGVDQRLIDAWVGHTTEEMRKRYRHLIPNVEQAAIRSVFDAPGA